MKLAAALSLALLLTSCGGPEGLVTILDKSYTVELLGGSETGFAAPDGLAWHDGSLLLADEGASALRQWKPGTKIHTLAQGQGIRSPEDVVRGPDGTLYFTDDDAGGVWRLKLTGTMTHLGKELQSTEGMTIGPAGALLVGVQSSGAIAVIDRDGRITTLVGPEAGISKPESMAFDNDGNLYIADNRADILYLLDRRGTLHRPIAGRSGFSPETIHYSDGALYITDSKHGALYRYTLEDGLSPIASFAGDLRNVQGITSDASGNLYVSVQTDLKGRRGYILRLSQAAPARQ